MSCASTERTWLPRPAPALSGGVGENETRRNTSNPDPKMQKTSKQTDKKSPDSQILKQRKTIERSGGAKISYPQLRLEMHLRYVGPPVQTR